MTLSPSPLSPNASVEEVAKDVLSGNMHFRAWCAVIDALYEVDPMWVRDGTKSAQENVVAWIRSKKDK